MTLLVPVMLFGWLPLSIIFFLLLPARTAVLCTVIGGFLFLPMKSFNLPGLPDYSKFTAVALGILLGGFVSGKHFQFPLRWSWLDLPMVVLCFVSPLATSLSNDLGWYDGLSGILYAIMHWGIVYWAGRRYFNTPEALEELSKGVLIGGLLYAPLCLYEIRMSPQLSNIFYGFFPHSFAQHMRYGGYRPIVFMQHGLMVALWMTQTAIVAFWLWRSKALKHLKGMPLMPLVVLLLVVTILCKSANAWFFLILGGLAWFSYGRHRSIWLVRLCLLLVPLYFLARVTMLLPAETMQEAASRFVDAERVKSFSIRLEQEDQYGRKALQQPWFGWGGYQRGAPVDPETGKKTLKAVDAMWTINFSTYGFAGLLSLYGALLIGPWLIFRDKGKHLFALAREQPNLHVQATMLSLVVVIFCMDSLMNSMISPVYILCSGALLGCHLSLRQLSSAV